MNDEKLTSAGGDAAAVHPLAMSELDTARAGEGTPLPLLGSQVELLGTLRNLKVKVTVCIGGTELTVGELLAARAQQVLPLDRTIEQPVDVLLEGQVVARGTLVAVEERFGVRITEVAVRTEAPAPPEARE
jgi:flagellar motor switch protein FliN/FliY